MADYCTVDDLRSYIGSDTTNFAGVAQIACTVASRTVEQLCERVFTQDATVSAQYFDPVSYWDCPTDDISTTVGLIVQTDDGGAGTYPTTWTYGTDFLLDPINQIEGGITGVPFQNIRALVSRGFFLNSALYRRPFVKVTAKWGWAAVPDNVRLAALVGAAHLFKQKDAADGFVGVNGWGPVQARQNPLVSQLLAPFMKAPVASA